MTDGNGDDRPGDEFEPRYPPLTFPYEISPQDCKKFGGQHKKDADAVAKDPKVAVREDYAGECVFDNEQVFLRSKILYLMFSPNVARVRDPEALTIRIQNPKSIYFDFLKAEATTLYGNTGYWRGFIEGNTEHEVLFFDSANDSVSPELLETLAEYNDKYVGETVLYTDIIEVDQTSLDRPDDYPHNL